MVRPWHIWEALKVGAARAASACIQPRTTTLMFMYEKLMRENRVSFEHMAARCQCAVQEENSLKSRDRLAENVEGARYYMVQVLAATGVAAAGSVAARVFPMYGETPAPVPEYKRRITKRRAGQMLTTPIRRSTIRGSEAAMACHNRGPSR